MIPYPPSATICAGIRRPNSVRVAHAVRAPASPSVWDRTTHKMGSSITGWAAAAREQQQNHREGSDRPTEQPQQAGACTLFFLVLF
jgi:hypothetical protein